MCFFTFSLVFSQSLLSLDLIEEFLAQWDKIVEPDPETQVLIFYILLKSLQAAVLVVC